MSKKLDLDHIKMVGSWFKAFSTNVLDGLDGDSLYDKQMSYNTINAVREILDYNHNLRNLLGRTILDKENFSEKDQEERFPKDVYHPIYLDEDEDHEDCGHSCPESNDEINKFFETLLGKIKENAKKKE